MEQLGLIFEILIFALGVYLYLFAKGFIKIKDSESKDKVEEFRLANAGWMRLLGLALAAVMLMNIIVHIQQLLA